MQKVVLYIDDDIDDTALLEGMFETNPGAPQLLTLNDSEQALEKISAIRQSGKEICFILLDINMPRLNGKSLAEYIKQQHGLRSTPIAFISTSGSPADKAFAANLGALFFQKPNSIQGMENLAKEIIDLCFLM